MSRRELVGLILGIALFVLFLILPPIGQITPLGMRTLGVFALTLVWWITEPVPMGATSFLALALYVATGIMDSAKAFGYLGNWINLFVLGAIGIGQGLAVTGAARRYALRMLSFRFVAGRPWRLLIMFLFAAALLSAFTSNTVTTVIFLTIGRSLLDAMGVQKGDKFAMAFVLSIAWAANIGGQLTPVGAATNPMAIGLAHEATGHTISFISWVLASVVGVVIAAITMVLVFRFILRPDVTKLASLRKELISDEYRKLGPMTLGEKLAWSYLGLALLCWVLPDILRPFFPALEGISDRLNWAVPALVIATLMCLTPISWKQRKRLMTFADWRGAVDLGIVSLIAICVSLGGVLTAPGTGITETATSVLKTVVGGGSPYVLVLISAGMVTLMTNFMSNLASMTLVMAVALPMAASLGIGNPLALAVTLCMSSSFAFAFPSATTTTAIVYATGYISIKEMLKNGLITALICTLPSSLLTSIVASWLIPYP